MEIIKKNCYGNPTDTISKYFKDVRSSTLLSVDEEVELANRINEGDEEAINKLIESNLKFVISVAKDYQGLGLSLGDLISEGNYGLIKAATKFDVTKGFRFISYAVYWIKQSILQSLNDNARTIRLPTNVITELNKITKGILEVDMSKTPIPHCVSLNDVVSTKRNGSESFELVNTIQDEHSHEFEIFDIEVNKLKKTINDSLTILNDRERGIIESYFGLNTHCESMTLEAIGDKYDLTKERVRQIKEKALRRLRHNNDELYLLLNN